MHPSRKNQLYVATYVYSYFYKTKEREIKFVLYVNITTWYNYCYIMYVQHTYVIQGYQIVALAVINECISVTCKDIQNITNHIAIWQAMYVLCISSYTSYVCHG